MDTAMENMVSFVIPCYRSENTVGSVVKEIAETMEKENGRDYEIIMVNDNAPDAAWDEIQRICRENEKCSGICFSRNFGQHAALLAGVRKSRGGIVICLDDDGQTPADEAGKLIRAIEEGADAVYASYDHKQHSAFRNLGTAMNEEMCRIMLGKPRDLFVSSYFAMRRFVADEVIRYRNSYPYMLGLVLRSAGTIVNVPVHHRKRMQGTSGYTFGKLLALWMNGFTAFSIKPLRIATSLGAFFALAAFLYGIYTLIKKMVNPAVPLGFSALMTAIVFFGGMLMLMVGLAGEYIGRTYISVNDAPQYVVRSVAGREESSDGTISG